MIGRPDTRLRENVLQCIGNTSLVPLRRLAPANGTRILLKLESENPTGSMKDRMALAMIEINRGCASTGVTLSVHNSLVCAPLLQWGNDEQKKRWLPRLASGELLGAYSLSEARSGSDAAALQCSAARDGDHWVIDGTKMWVTSGDRAGVVLVYVRTDPNVPKAKGISAFLVPTDTPGFRVGKHEKKTGIRGSSTVEIVFEDVRVSPSALLGGLGQGLQIALDTLDGKTFL